MSKRLLFLTALAASSQAMVQFGNMVARRTDALITAPPPQPTHETFEELEKRLNGDPALEGYTSEFGACKSTGKDKLQF
jgi:hypothetical protein